MDTITTSTGETVDTFQNATQLLPDTTFKKIKDILDNNSIYYEDVLVSPTYGVIEIDMREGILHKEILAELMGLASSVTYLPDRSGSTYMEGDPVIYLVKYEN